MRIIFLLFILIQLTYGDLFQGNYKNNGTQVANGIFKIDGKKEDFKLYVSLFTEQDPKQITFYDRVLNISVSFG